LCVAEKINSHDKPGIVVAPTELCSQWLSLSFSWRRAALSLQVTMNCLLSICKKRGFTQVFGQAGLKTGYLYSNPRIQNGEKMQVFFFTKFGLQNDNLAAKYNKVKHKFLLFLNYKHKNSCLLATLPEITGKVLVFW
jgi:hypothetical protein